MNEFSLYSQETITNKELTITFTPKNTTKYTYEIIKDNKLVESYNVNNNKVSEIRLYETGEFQIKVTVYKNNKKEEITSGIYRLDLDKPIIRLKDTSEGDILTMEQLKKDEKINFNDYIIATDNIDGELSNKVTSNINEIDLTKLGIHKLTYTVSDEAGNIALKTVNLNITKNTTAYLLFFQIFIITALFIFIGFILKYRRSVKLERRISKYSVEALSDKSISLFDKMINYIKSGNDSISNYISSSLFIKKYGNKYEKYINLYKPFYNKGTDFIATKIIVSLLLIVIAIFSKTIQYQVMSLYELFLPLLFGFFLPDILYIYKYRNYRNTLENDLLQAIIIMNNAFKSGRSITQAIELVTEELDGPISEEFKKMSMELSFGLSVDSVFERFSDRIKLEEITYLTSSLTILNKTGGNIIKVFSSIEKSLFNKKKLKLELNSLTGSSKIIVYALFIIPLLFIIFISLLNPSYFKLFYTTNIGLILSGIMLVIYITYVLFVKKIMKVRM